MGIIVEHLAALVDSGVVSHPVHLQIDGTRIGAVSDSPAKPSEGDVVIDGSGKVAIPGFVNAHTHLPMTLLRGLADDLPLETWLEEHIWPRERRLNEDDVYWGAMLALAEMIRGGTTTCADMYFHVDGVGRAVEEAGTRALLSYGIIAETLDAHGREEMARAEAVIDRWHGAAGGRIRAAVSPHAVYTCGEDVWRAATSLAAKHGVVLHTHLAETRTEVKWCLDHSSASPVKTLDGMDVFSVQVLAAHCVRVDEEDIAILAERGVTPAHCPKSNAKLANGVAPVAAMLKRGATVALGTDGAASNNALDMVEEMRMAALLQKGWFEDPSLLKAGEALTMATKTGAVGLGFENASLTVGGTADLVLIDVEGPHTLPAHDPRSALVYAAKASDVTDVIVAGKILLRDGKLQTIDEERLKHEIGRLSSKYRN